LERFHAAVPRLAGVVEFVKGCRVRDGGFIERGTMMGAIA
jgi:hypothetical protein